MNDSDVADGKLANWPSTNLEVQKLFQCKSAWKRKVSHSERGMLTIPHEKQCSKAKSLTEVSQTCYYSSVIKALQYCIDAAQKVS